MAVAGEAGLHPLLQNLPQADVQGPDEVDGRGAEVGGLPGLVRLHNRQPVGPVGIIVLDGCLPLPEGLHGPAPGEDDGQPRRDAQGLLGGGEDQVHAPLLGPQFLPAHAADAVHHHQHAVLLPQRGQGRDVGQDGGGGIHVSDSHQFEGSGAQCGLHRLRRVADRGRVQPDHLRAVPLQDGGEAVPEVAGADDQRPVPRLYQVGRGHVHRQGAGAGNDEGRAVGEEEDLPQPLQRLSEDLNKVGSNVAGSGKPHRRQHLRRELHRAGNHQEFAAFHWVTSE